MSRKRSEQWTQWGQFYALLILAVILNVAMWLGTHKMQPRWPNVPPPPSKESAVGLGLGDRQLAYRVFAYPLQVMGNEAGKSTPLYQYDYNRLGRWFHVLHDLDPYANYVPYIAGYYFGSTQKPKEQLQPVIDYLLMVGREKEPGKWRWFMHAVYLAHYRMKDYPYAFELANELAKLPQPMPHWARQMPAILTAARGDKAGAVKIMRSILQSTIAESERRGHTPDAFEVRFMLEFICKRMQTPAQAAADPVCQAATP